MGRLTRRPTTLARAECGDSWSAGELACWRWRAGLYDELAAELCGRALRLRSPGSGGERRSAGASSAARTRPRSRSLTPRRGRAAPGVRRAECTGARPPRRSSPGGCASAASATSREARAPTRENPAGLTARELEVLALLVEGLRNAEIAERLFVSEKTVDHHVSAILRKLDVPTRAQAAREATRRELTA